MEARIRDLELELDEEKRRHAETIKILRKKERTVKEVILQCEEDQKNVILLQETLEKATQKINIYKRQLNEQVRKKNETNFWIYPYKIFHFPHSHTGGYVATICHPCPPFPTWTWSRWRSCRPSWKQFDFDPRQAPHLRHNIQRSRIPSISRPREHKNCNRKLNRPIHPS